MGKKGSWFSKIKRVFTPHSKEKLVNQEAERKSGKEKRKQGFGKLRCGDTSSFLPIFREPSSIEKIFGEAERDHNLVFRPPTPSDRSNPSSPSPPPPPLRPTSPRVASPRAASPELPHSLPRADLPRSLSPNPPDRSKPSSSSASAPPPPPASTRVPSQRVSPPSIPSPKPVTQKVSSPQAVSIKPPSPRGDSPQALPLNPSPREDPPRLETPRPSSPKPPSPRAEPPKLDSPRPPSPSAEPPRLDAPRPTAPMPLSPKAVSPKAVQRQEIVSRAEPTLSVQHSCATKIQAAFRGYKARRSFRAHKGLARLQGVVKGYNVKRQTVNAMKYMQKLVRVQSQIQSRRIKTSENQAQVEKDEAKQSASEAGNDNWDHSVLTKEERDARSQRKIDAIIKRERYIAYAYSHKLLKNSPKYAQDIRTSGGLPLWWNWGDRQLSLASSVPSHSQPLSNYMLTPTRLSPVPPSQSSNQHHFIHNNFDTSTPTSSRSTFLTPSRPFHTSRYSRGRLSGLDSPFKDDDSFTSCPPYPRYMAPTISAKAKVRPSSNPKERVMGTPSVSSETRRMSYPITQQGLDMFRWNKGSLHVSNSHIGPGSPGNVVLQKQKTLKSVGNLSNDTTVSMPATVGRRPFNRYV